MVVLAASICTRGGKAVLSRSFREMQRSRIEALLASFPKLADGGTQHTTVEQDNVRYVYQPLDELYMVLITNRQSNILQDIDSLHLFAQVVTSICRNLDEREILKNSFELLSAFDELVTQGYRENLTLTQIKTFLEMESHEERVAMIIEANKKNEADQHRKEAAKRLEMQRREQTRLGRSQQAPRQPSYPTYTPPVSTTQIDPMEGYAAEKNRISKQSQPLGKGMQLGKKSKTTNMYEQVRGGLPDDGDASGPLVTPAVTAPAQTTTHAPRESLGGEREAIHVTLNETIAAKLSREGTMESFEVKGDLQLRINDASMTQIKLNLSAPDAPGVQFNTHPKVDKPLFNSSKVVQLKDTSKGFPAQSTPLGVMRWRYLARPGESVELPLTLSAWISPTGDGYEITVEYELTGGDTLKDVTVTIPFAANEPAISTFDAVYELSGDSIDWTIGDITPDNASGSFGFEAQADSESDFFPMSVRFSKTKPFVDVDVLSATLISMDQNVPFSKDVKSVAESYVLE